MIELGFDRFINSSFFILLYPDGQTEIGKNVDFRGSYYNGILPVPTRESPLHQKSLLFIEKINENHKIPGLPPPGQGNLEKKLTQIILT